MDKILTVSVAAYNVSSFLRQTLDSCIVDDAGIMDDLEVLIVNDGSKDDTPDIAREYESRYPGTFRLINKENGGYGSTVNRSMSEAKGKYFKLLDGDDWFDKDGLRRLVLFLRACEADLVLSGRCEVDENGAVLHTDNDWEKLYGAANDGQTLLMDELKKPFVYGIWVTTYKTELLRAHPFSMPERQLYTDRFFIFCPIPWIKTVAFQNYNVYCYRVGHEGQSVSVENRVRHSKEAIDGFERLLEIYGEKCDMPRVNLEFYKLRFARYYNNVLQTILLLPASMRCQAEIKRLDKKIRDVSEELYMCCGENNSMLSAFRRYTYALYWLRKLKKVRNWH